MRLAMVFNHTYRIEFKDCGKENEAWTKIYNFEVILQAFIQQQ